MRKLWGWMIFFYSIGFIVEVFAIVYIALWFHQYEQYIL